MMLELFDRYSRHSIAAGLLLWAGSALSGSGQVVHSVSALNQASFCDTIAVTTRFQNTGATLDGLTITQLLPHADFVYVPGSGVITMPNGAVLTNDPSISGQSLVWDFSSAVSSSSLNHLLITEVFADPTNAVEEAYEWIELFNPLAAAVDMTGWSIRDALPGQVDALPSFVIQPGEFVVIAASTNAFAAEHPGYTGRVFQVADGTLGSGLNNFADGVFLLNPSLTAVDAVSYGGSAAAFSPAVPVPPQGQSIQRVPANQDNNNRNDWQAGAPTPGTGTLVSGINAGSSLSIVYRVEVACGSVAGQIRSLATYQQPAGGTLRTNESSIFITVNPGDLTITKSPVLQDAGVGDEVVWTVTVKNEGFGHARNVVVEDNIGSGVAFSSFSINPTNAQPFGSQVVWDSSVIPALTNLAPQQEVSIVVTGIVTACTGLFNRADARWGCLGKEVLPDGLCEDTALGDETAGASLRFIDRYPFLTTALTPASLISLDYCDGAQLTLYVTNAATGPNAGTAFNISYIGLVPDGYTVQGPGVTGNTVSVGTLAPGASTNVTFTLIPGTTECPVNLDKQPLYFYGLYEDACGNPFIAAPNHTEIQVSGAPWASVRKIMPGSVNPQGSGFPVTLLYTYSNFVNFTANMIDWYPQHTNLAVANVSSGGVLNTNAGTIAWNPVLNGSGVYTASFDMVFLNPCSGPFGLIENTVTASNIVDCQDCVIEVAGSGATYYSDIANWYCATNGTGTCAFTSTKDVAPEFAEVCEPVQLTHRFTTFIGDALPTSWNGMVFTSRLANGQAYLYSTSSVQVLIDGTNVTPYVNITAISPRLTIDLAGLNSSPFPNPDAVADSLVFVWEVATTNVGIFTDVSSLPMPPCGIEEGFETWEVGQSLMRITLEATPFVEACGFINGKIDLTQDPSPQTSLNGGRIFPSYDVEVVLDLDADGSGTNTFSYVAGSTVFSDFYDLGGSPISSVEPTIQGNTLVWNLGDVRSNGVGTIEYRLRASCETQPGEKQVALVRYNNRCEDGSSPQRVDVSATNTLPTAFAANLNYQIKPEIVFLQDNTLVYTLEFINMGAGAAYNVTPEFIFPAGVSFSGASIAPATVSSTNAIWDLAITNAVDSLVDADGDGFFDDLLPGGTFSIVVTSTVIDCLESTVRLRATHGCGGASCQVPEEDTATFVPMAGSLVTRTVFPSDAELCATNTARYEVRNSGLIVDRIVQVQQILPTGMVYVAGSARYVIGGVTNPASDPSGTTTLLFTETNIPPFSVLQPGEELAILYDVYVSCDAVFGDATFRASGTFVDLCGNVISNQITQSVMPVKEPVLDLTKEARNPTGLQTNFTTGTVIADPGDTIVYRLTIEHNSSSSEAPAHAMELTDDWPVGLRFDGASVTPDAVTTSGPNVQLVWSNSTLLSLIGGGPWSEASSTQIVVTLTGTVTNCVFSIPNQASLAYGCDPSCLSLSDAAVHTLSSDPNMAFASSSSLELTPCGGVRTLVITNNGATASGIIVSNNAPSGYLFTTASATGEFNSASLNIVLTGTPVGAIALIDLSTAASSGATDIDDDAGDGLPNLDLGYRDAVTIRLNLISDGTGLDCLADPTDLDFADPDPAVIPSRSASSTLRLNNQCLAGETITQTSSTLPDQPDPDIDLQPNSIIVTNSQVVTFTATVKNNAEQGNAENLHIRLAFGSGWTNLTFVSSNIVSSGTTSMLLEMQGSSNVLVSLPGVILNPIGDHVILTFNATVNQGGGPLTARAEVVGECPGGGITPACVFTNTLGEAPLANSVTGSVIGAVNGVYYGFDQDQSLGLGYDLVKTVRLAGEPAPGGSSRYARIGEDLIYRIHATYFGQTFSNVVVTESLPTNLVFGTPVDAGSSPDVLGWTWNPATGHFTLPSPITNNVDFIVDIPVIVRNIAANQGETNNQTIVTNIADSIFSVNGATNVPTPSSTTVPLQEPNLRVTKTAGFATNALQAGDIVYFTNVVEHTSLSQTTAYDIVFTDTLPPGLTFTGVSLGTDGRDNDGDGSTDEGDEGTLISGNTITITTNNNPALSALATNQTLTFVFSAIVDSQFVGDSITNVAKVTWTSLPGVGTNGNERTGDDGPGGLNDYETTDPEPLPLKQISAVQKELIWTSQTNTVNPHVTIGERMVYRLRVDVPQGVVSNLVVTDIVPTGLDFVGTNPNVGMNYPSYGYAFEFQVGGPTFNTNTVVVTDPDPTPASSLTTDGSGQNITFTIGTFTNAPDGNLANDFFYLYMEFVVLDMPINSGLVGNSYSNANRATVSDAFSSVTVTSPIYQVAEHLTSIRKTRSPAGQVDAGDLLTFNIIVSNSTTALANAYDLVARDVLTNTLFDTSTLVNTALPPGWALATNALPGAAELVFSSLPGVALTPGQSVTGSFTVVAAQSLRPNQRFTNAVQLIASDTIDGTQPGGIDDRDRTANAVVTLSVANLRFAKSLFATSETNLVDSTSTNVQVGEIVTYRLDVTMPETTITNLLVTDDLPLGLSYIIGSARVDTNGFAGTLGTFNVLGPVGTHGTPAPSGSNVVIRFDGLSEIAGDNNTNNNSFAIFLDAIVLNTNGVVGLPGNQSRLTNTAVVTYTGNPSNAVPTAPVVTPVIEPRVSIEKTIAETVVDAGDRISVSLAITNNGLATAYNLELRDALNPLYFDAASVSNTLTPAGFLFAVETNDVVIRTDTNAVQPDGTLAVGQTLTFTFDVTIAQGLPPNTRFTNTATVVWDSISGVKTIDQQRVYGPTSAIDRLASPNITAAKTLFSTSENGPVDSVATNTQIGELLTYRIRVTLPEGTLTNLVINDALPDGLAYVLGSARTDVSAFGGTLGTLSAVPTGVGLGGDGQDVAVTFLGNTVVTGDNDGNNNSFDLFLDVVVLDVPGNTGLLGSQTAHTNTASVTYQGNPSNAVPTGSVITHVIEPDLDILKEIDLDTGDAGDVATITLTVTNNGLATAYNVVVTDLVEAAFFDITTLNPVTIPAGFVYTVVTNLPDATVFISSDAGSAQPTNSIEAGESLTFVFTAALSQDVIPGRSYSNVAGVERYDSIDGSPTSGVERPYTGPESGDNVIVPLYGLAKSLVRTSETGPVDTAGSDVTIGEVVTYRLEITMPESTVTNLFIHDFLPVGMTYWSNVVVDTSGFGGTLPLGGPTVSGGESNGAPVTFTFVGPIVTTDDNNTNNNSFAIEFDALVLDVPSNDGLPSSVDGTDTTSLTNVALMSHLGNMGDPTRSDPVVVEVVEPSLLIEKTMSGPSNGVVEMTLVVTNRGLSTAFDVVVTDQVRSVWFDTTTLAPVSIPAGFTFAVAGAPGDATVTLASDPSSGQPTNSIEVGETLVFRFSAVLLPSAVGTVSNTAVVSEYSTLDGDDPNERDEPPVEDDDELPLPSFAVTKTLTSPTGRPADVGETVVFTITVTNTGPIGLAVVPLADLYDAAILEFSNAVPVHSSAGVGTVNWTNVGPLAVGGSTNVLVYFNALASTSPGDTTNTVVASAITTNNLPLPPQTSTVPVEVLTPGFTLLKQRITPTGVATVGQDVVFTITVANNGEVALNPVPVNDTYDASILTFVSASPAEDLASPGSLTWNNVGPLGVGDSVVLTTRYTAAASTWPDDSTNIAVATATTTNGVPLDPQTSSVPVEVAAPAIGLIKLAGSAPDNGIHYTNAGSDVVYTYMITNSGDTYLSSVTVTDDVLGVIGTVSGVLAPGDTATLYFTSSIPTAVTNWGTVVGTPSYTNGTPINGLTNVVATNDAIVQIFAAIGDTVWLDVNGDGIQSGGSETGMPNLTVTLYDAQTNVLGTTTTDASGYYTFTNLVPGAYFVGFTPPSGYMLTAQDQGGDDALDSDADPITGLTALTILESGEYDPTWDAGLMKLASLGDYVWNDLNGDGIQDVGEPGFSNVTVTLYDAASNAVGTTTTDASGFYIFTNLTPATYFVGFTPPAGFVFTLQDQGGDDTLDSDVNPLTGFTIPTALESGENDLTWDAGLVQPAALGDFVWNDLNADGIQDPGEPGYPGVPVNLLSNGTVIASTTTDVNGAYAFTNLWPGEYAVEFVLPGNVVPSPQDQGSDDAVDSDADTGTGRTGTVTLESGDNNTTLDAGLYIPARLGDYVWLDRNGDGIQDAGEPGVSNVTVTLYDAQTNVLGTTTTDSTGLYGFTNLVPGVYFVGFTLPSGFEFTRQDQGVDDRVDSDADILSGFTIPTTLISSENDPTWDAGLVERASLGDFVWEDLNADGIQDVGEPGFSNVVVNLLSNGTVIATTTTDVNGAYAFTNLWPGDYEVEFVPPAGTVFSPQDQGIDDTVDSDADTGTGRTGTITLESGENNQTLDGGLYIPASLGDYVWLDRNGDGIQDVGEPGFSNVTVTLYDALSNVVGTTTTDAAGFYIFTNLTPNTYFVGFTPPSGFEFTRQDQGGDDTLDSDVNPLTGFTIATTLISGENDPTWDAGLVERASLGDFVWNDLNADGIQDVGEPGFSNVVVNLLSNGTVIATTTTDVNGAYAFTNLWPGDYQVEFVPPAGSVLTGQDQGSDDALDSDPDRFTGLTGTITLESGDNDTTIDAGLYIPASLGDYVWLDVNADGIQSGGSETGIPGVVVHLYDGSLNLVDTTATDTNGYYSFTNLVPGTYSVGFELPAGYLFTLQDQGSDDSLDSDADPITGATIQTTLVSGENDPTWDAGLYVPASLGDYVWLDRNGDGIQDVGEPGFSNVVVTLYDAASNVVGTTTTDASGFYSFTNLIPSTYFVGFTPPSGFEFTRQDQGGDDTLDSDVNPLTGFTIPTTLISGENDLTWDAGLVERASLGDFVWEDMNADGIQDVGEPGFSNVVVNLLSNGTVIATTTTDVNGAYAFTNLWPGDYQVEFIPPAGTVLTPQDQGSDDTVDSDADTGTGRTGTVTLESGENNTTLDAGLYIPASLGDFVWLDVNGDGIQSGGSETGIPSVVVTLYDAQSNALGTTTTDATGFYSFTNLVPGTYFVGFTPPTGYALTLQDEGGDDTLDSDADRVTGFTAPTTLISGENDPTWDAGLYVPASLGNYVWDDLNRDGIQGGTEPGVSNVTVRLYDAASVLIGTTTTDATGFYSFTNLIPGVYSVEFVLPPSYEFTLQDQGSDDALDSDADPITGATIQTTLVSGENDLTWDVGIFRRASLGDFVWHDVDGNGIQDAGETGIVNVVVNLLDASSNIVATTVTDSSGYYSFTNLLPGAYAIEVIPPAGLAFSLPGQGGDSSLDSDIHVGTGRSDLVTLISGEHNPDLDAGLHVPASLGDFVWHDYDGDGLQGSSETGMPDVVVNLYNTNGVIVATTTTDVSGAYIFTNLMPAFYYVEFVPPTGYQITKPDVGIDDEQDSDADQTTGLTAVTQLLSGENDLSWDAGLYLPATLGDQVFEDLNYDSIFDGPGEITAAVTGLTVNLYLHDGTYVTSTVTDASGLYLFTNLPPAAYVVEFTKPTNFVFVTPVQGSDPTVDSDADQVTGRTEPITLYSGDDDRTWDAGLAQYGALGDFVWWDINDDGIHGEDLSFYGINNVTVRLYRVQGGVTSFLSQAVTATDTNGNKGHYFFPALEFGDYFVQVDTHGIPNYLPRHTTVLSYSVTISPDYVYIDADFGFNTDPTAITLRYLKAVRTENGVRVQWETASEFENLGYHIYRASTENGQRVRLTGEMIMGQGTGSGATYSFDDVGVDADAAWYWLEDVSETFESTLHGPVSVEDDGDDDEQAPTQLVGTFALEPADAGIYRLSAEALSRAGIAANALRVAEIKLVVEGKEVALLPIAKGETLAAGDSVLFYVPAHEEALSISVETSADAARMGWAYAEPASEGTLWTGVVRSDGQLPFVASSEWQRYLLVGFEGDGALVLDVTNANRPLVLFDYTVLNIPGQSGLLLSYEVEEAARCFAAQLDAVRDVQGVTRAEP
ncbi:MAG: isopeptide-forming domain-containing fimbrial protein [Kiritimatiellae bacterium]|nr:isopeptide-forming domain-containing fimbrial protein [Kiritimatiellia bacterium]